MILPFVWKAVTVKEYKIIVLPIVLYGLKNLRLQQIVDTLWSIVSSSS
jgi:hypothetical protein